MRKRNYLLVIFIFLCGISFAQNEVRYMWCGALTPFSIKVNAKLTDTCSAVRLVLSTNPQFISPIYSPIYSVDTNTHLMAAMGMTGLTPNTKYYYAVESAGVLDSSADDVGSFTTCNTGPSSFSFVTGSCCLYSAHGIYDAMRNQDPLFFSCTGDMHYANPNSATNINIHRDAYETQVLSKTRAANFYKKVPFEYVWDDHDFSGNDSDSSFAGKANARKAYREYVPHYPLPAGSGNNAIYQSFVIGRVHFIHTDLRSERYGTSMMGAAQKIWFKNECMSAKNNNEMICWFSSSTWSGNVSDNWGGYTVERTELSNFFRDSLIENMFIVCGDAHMIGIDDGSNSNFSTFMSNNFLFPLFNAAPLNQNGSYKGGTFSEGGYFPSPSTDYGQFGLITVNDTGGSDICISLDGYRCDSTGGAITFLAHYQFCRTLGPVLTGISEQKDNAAASLFPNPTEGRFIFKTAGNLNEAKIRISDILGNEINAGNLYSVDANTVQFDLSGLSSGTYFITVRTKDQVYERKVMIY